jgi:hypothetical protein
MFLLLPCLLSSMSSCPVCLIGPRNVNTFLSPNRFSFLLLFSVRWLSLLRSPAIILRSTFDTRYLCSDYLSSSCLLFSASLFPFLLSPLPSHPRYPSWTPAWPVRAVRPFPVTVNRRLPRRHGFESQRGRHRSSRRRVCRSRRLRLRHGFESQRRRRRPSKWRVLRDRLPVDQSGFRHRTPEL